MNELPSFADKSVRDAYDKLKYDLDWILDFSGQFWNWPSLATITAPTLVKLFSISAHLKRTQELDGSICEFGTHIFTKLKVIRHLVELTEQNVRGGGLFGFDHLKGYAKNTQPTDYKFSDKKDLFLVENPQEVQDSLDRFNNATKVIYQSTMEIIFIDGSLPESYAHAHNQAGPIRLSYFDLQDVEVMSRLVPMVLENCCKGALLVFEGYGLHFFPKTTSFINKLIEETKGLVELELESQIPFSKVVEFLG